MSDTQNNPAAKAERSENRILMTALAIMTVICIVLAIIGFCFLNKPSEIVEGQADATSIRISGKLPGRIVKLYVHEEEIDSGPYAEPQDGRRHPQPDHTGRTRYGRTG